MAGKKILLGKFTDKVLIMARIYARKRGKSGSKKPLAKAKWVELGKEEIERLVVKLAHDKMQSAQIGLTLRDKYGIPSVRHATEKKVGRIVAENGLAPKIPEDLFNLLKKAVKLREHMEKNKKDYHSKHGLELMESKIRRLVKYYVREEKLAEGWKYDAERAKLIVQTGG